MRRAARIPRLVLALGSGVVAGGAALISLVKVGAPLVVVVIVGAGVAVATIATIVAATAVAATIARLESESLTQRLAIASMARDLFATARSVRRLEQSTRRGIAAAFGVEAARVSAGTTPDGATLAAMVALGTSRELHYVGDVAGFDRHRDAWRAIDPDATLGRLPEGGEVAYLDRRGQRIRGGTASFPTFVVDDGAHLERLIAGELAQLVVDVLRVPDFLVVLPPALRALARQGGPGSTVEALGDAIILVRRIPAPGGAE